MLPGPQKESEMNQPYSASPDVTDTSIAELVSLRGRTAVVTGGARGIGYAVASRLAEAGAHILLADINQAEVERSASELASRWGVTAKAVQVDVTDVGAVDALAEQAEALAHGLNVWVNNAGIYPATPVREITDEEWAQVLDVTLTGTFNGSRAAARILADHPERPGRVIINLSSVAGLRGRGRMASYVAAKHGVSGLTRGMAIELGPLGVRVLGIAPSVVDTPGMRERRSEAPGDQAAALKAFEEGIIASIPLARSGVPDDVARLALYCASDLSSFISGQVLSVDGGLTAA